MALNMTGEYVLPLGRKDVWKALKAKKALDDLLDAAN
jgi:hypothetical protein